MNTRIYITTATVFTLAILLGWLWWKSIAHIESTDNAYVRGSITTISSRISGHVMEVPGIVNTEVKAGDLLVVFDKEPFEATYDAAMAELDEAEAQILEVKAKIISIDAKVNEANARKSLNNAREGSALALSKAKISNMELLKLEKDRAEKLFKSKTVSKARLDSANASYSTSLHQVQQAQSDVSAAKFSSSAIDAEIEEIYTSLNKLKAEELRFEAKRDVAQAKLKSAKINLDSTTIRSPIDGMIANRIVEPGVYMENGWPLMSIVPVRDVWVVANYKETQMKNIKIGQKVSIKVDAFKNKIINGTVLSISPASASSFSLLPPQNASGNFVKVVQRVPVKITIDLPEVLVGRLVPGMSVISKVDTLSNQVKQ